MKFSTAIVSTLIGSAAVVQGHLDTVQSRQVPTPNGRGSGYQDQIRAVEPDGRGSGYQRRGVAPDGRGSGYQRRDVAPAGRGSGYQRNAAE